METGLKIVSKCLFGNENRKRKQQEKKQHKLPIQGFQVVRSFQKKQNKNKNRSRSSDSTVMDTST